MSEDSMFPLICQLFIYMLGVHEVDLLFYLVVFCVLTCLCVNDEAAKILSVFMLLSNVLCYRFEVIVALLNWSDLHFFKKWFDLSGRWIIRFS